MDGSPYKYPEQQMTNFCADPKVMEFVQKNKELIDEGKDYEFLLKIKSLAKMRASKKRQQEGELLLLAGFDALIRNEKVKPLALKDILEGVINIYVDHNHLLTSASQKRLLWFLFYREWITQESIDALKKMLTKCGKPADHPTLTKAIIAYEVKNGQFNRVEKYAASLTQQVAIEFVDQWSTAAATTKQEIPALWCRMVLARAVLIDFQEGDKFFSKIRQNISNENPYLLFTGFLLKTVRMKSKEAYEIIEHSYSEFLEEDIAFRSLYKAFGQKYFGVEKSKGGLLGLLQ